MDYMDPTVERICSSITKLRDVILALEYLRDVGRLAETAASSHDVDLNHLGHRVLSGSYAILDVLWVYGLELLEKLESEVEKMLKREAENEKASDHQNG